MKLLKLTALIMMSLLIPSLLAQGSRPSTPTHEMLTEEGLRTEQELTAALFAAIHANDDAGDVDAVHEVLELAFKAGYEDFLTVEDAEGNVQWDKLESTFCKLGGYYDGRTPLYVAARLGNTEIVAELCAAGADMTKGCYIWSPSKRLLSLISTKFSKVYPVFCPIHVAAGRGHLDVVKLLIELGEPIDRQSPFNDSTPLHHAAGWDQIEVLEFLYKHGANIAHKMKNSIAFFITYTPEQIARERSCRKAAKYLRDLEALA